MSMMASELKNLPAELEDGEIDSTAVDSAGLEEDGADNEQGSSSKKHSKRISDGSSKGKRKLEESQSDKLTAKRAKEAKSQKRSSHKRRYNDSDQPSQSASISAKPTEDLTAAAQDQRHGSADRPHKSRLMNKDKIKSAKRSKWSYYIARKREEKAPVIEEPPAVCAFYIKGCCKKGENCQFSHAGQPEKKPLLCKFYAAGNCGNGSNCLFLHSEFPCRFFHLPGLRCAQGPECRFSHDPLTPDMRAALELDVNSDSRFAKANEASSKSEASYTDSGQQMRPSLLGLPRQAHSSAEFETRPAGYTPPLDPSQNEVDNEATSLAQLQELFAQEAHPQQQPLERPPPLQSQQPFKQMLFPPRPFPRPSEPENRLAAQLSHQQLQTRPPTLPYSPDLRPASSTPPPVKTGVQLHRPAYSGGQPPERPFPSAPRNCPPVSVKKPSAAAVAAASRALDAVASLLSEFCTESFNRDVHTAQTKAAELQISPPTSASAKVCKQEPDSASLQLCPAPTGSESPPPPLVFRAPPTCPRKLPWRLIPLDPIKQLSYAALSQNSTTSDRQLTAAADPRLQSTLADPRFRSRKPEATPLMKSESEPEKAAKSVDALKIDRAGRLQLNERSTAVATTADASSASVEQKASGSSSRQVFDPRFRRHNPQ